MKPYTFSIAICTYNGENFIEEQLESIFSQSRMPDELIIYDDCSSDSTYELIQKYSRRSSITVSLNSNETRVGITENFDKAIKACSGDIIVLSDQDDTWNVNKLSKLEEIFIANSNVGFIVSNAEIVDENLKNMDHDWWRKVNFNVNNYKKANLLESLVVANYFPGATMAFKKCYRSIISPIPKHLDPCTWLHDGWIAILLSQACEVELVPEPLIKYRQHENNQIGIKDICLDNKFLRLLSFIKGQKIYKRDILIDSLEKQKLNFLLVYQRLKENDLLTETAERLLNGKIQHLTQRINLSSSIHKRIVSVLGELGSINYHRYSYGISTAIRDILLT
jgi:glycosyltransferase involved in cell wall biosynthesis